MMMSGLVVVMQDPVVGYNDYPSLEELAAAKA